MCLYIDKKISCEPKVATEDIICYKILESKDDFKTCYTPYMYMSVKLPSNVRSKLQRKPGDLGTIHTGLHTYSNKTQAIKALKHLRMTFESSRFRLYKCTIPAGSLYWEGSQLTSSCKLNTYCSNGLFFPAKAISV